MPIKDTIDDLLNSYVRSGHQPHPVTEDFYQQIKESYPDGRLLQIEPYPENEGLEAGEEFLQSIHDLRPERLGMKNSSKTYGFEIWFTGGKIQFFFYAPDEATEKKFRKQLDAEYPQAKIIEQTEKFPDLYDTDHIAGAELELKQSNFYPIKNSRGVRDFIHDPYRLVTSDMVSKDENRVLIQILFQPALPSWTTGGKFGKINPWKNTMEDTARSLKEDKITESVGGGNERKATREERKLSQVIAEQEGLPAYNTNIRILTISPYQGEARSNAWSIAKTFEQSYQEAGNQTLVQRPLGGKFLREMVTDTVSRTIVNNGMVLTVPELAAVAHVPNNSIETPAVQWNYTQTGGRLPAEAERFQPSVGDDEKRLKGAQTGSDDIPLQMKKLSDEDTTFRTVTEDMKQNENEQVQTTTEQNRNKMNQNYPNNNNNGIISRLRKALGLGGEGAGLQPIVEEENIGDLFRNGYNRQQQSQQSQQQQPPQEQPPQNQPSQEQNNSPYPDKPSNQPQQPPQEQPPQNQPSQEQNNSPYPDKPSNQPQQPPQEQPPQNQPSQEQNNSPYPDKPSNQQNNPSNQPNENESHPLDGNNGTEVPAGVDPADYEEESDEEDEEEYLADPWDDDDGPSPFEEDIPEPGS